MTLTIEDVQYHANPSNVPPSLKGDTMTVTNDPADVADLFTYFSIARRFEYTEGRSNKFWTILRAETADDTSYVLRTWGKIEGAAFFLVTAFDTANQAYDFLEKTVLSKKNEGYQEDYIYLSHGEGYDALRDKVITLLRRFRDNGQMPVWFREVGEYWVAGDRPGTGRLTDGIPMTVLWEMYIRLNHANKCRWGTLV